MGHRPLQEGFRVPACRQTQQLLDLRRGESAAAVGLHSNGLEGFSRDVAPLRAKALNELIRDVYSDGHVCDSPHGFSRTRQNESTGTGIRADLFAIGVAMKVFQIYEGTPVLKDLKATFDRIARLLPESVRIAPSSLVEKLWVHPQPVRAIAREVWAATANALREKTQLEIDYRKPTGQSSRRLVEPLVLVHMNWDWLLAARDPEDGLTKTFYLARIREARNTNFHFTPPKDFDAATHFGDSIGLYVGGKPFRFKVRVAKEIAPWITEVRWHPAQKLEALKNGDVVLDLPAGSLIEAKRFVLSLGRFGKALGPKELVGEMKMEIRAMIAGVNT